jgi:hypothetical protein
MISRKMGWLKGPLENSRELFLKKTRNARYKYGMDIKYIQLRHLMLIK